MIFKKYTSAHAGFIHIGVLIAAVLVVTASSFVGFEVYHARSTSATSSEASAAPSPNPTSQGTTGLRGYATLYPSRPTCASANVQTTSDCTSKYEHSFNIAVIDAKSQHKIATITSDAHGEFAYDLVPGTYSIEAENLTAMSSQPIQVTVGQGKVTAIVIAFDSGIR